MPKVIISASGMATGGRVLHHLKAYGPDARNTVLFSGYQAAGTRGQALLGGAREVKVHGQWIPIRAEVANLPMLSAHADVDEIMRNFRELIGAQPGGRQQPRNVAPRSTPPGNALPGVSGPSDVDPEAAVQTLRELLGQR